MRCRENISVPDNLKALSAGHSSFVARAPYGPTTSASGPWGSRRQSLVSRPRPYRHPTAPGRTSQRPTPWCLASERKIGRPLTPDASAASRKENQSKNSTRPCPSPNHRKNGERTRREIRSLGRLSRPVRFVHRSFVVPYPQGTRLCRKANRLWGSGEACSLEEKPLRNVRQTERLPVDFSASASPFASDLPLRGRSRNAPPTSAPKSLNSNSSYT